MIFQLLFSLIFGLLGVLLFFLPGFGDVPLLLPWGIDELFVSIVTVFKGAFATLPYLEVTFTVFLYALAFELAMVVLRLFLGHRLPGHQIN